MKTQFQKFEENWRKGRVPFRSNSGVLLVAVFLGSYSPAQAGWFGLFGLGARAGAAEVAGAAGLRAAGGAAVRSSALRGAATPSSNALRSSGAAQRSSSNFSGSMNNAASALRLANQSRSFGAESSGGSYDDRYNSSSQPVEDDYSSNNSRSYSPTYRQPPPPRYEQRRVYMGKIWVGREYVGTFCVGRSWDPYRGCWINHMRDKYRDVWRDQFEYRTVRVR